MSPQHLGEKIQLEQERLICRKALHRPRIHDLRQPDFKLECMASLAVAQARLPKNPGVSQGRIFVEFPLRQLIQ